MRWLSGFLFTVCLSAQGIGARHDLLRRDLTQWHAQGARITDAMVESRLAMLSSAFQGFSPLLGGFSPADYQANRSLVRQSLAWLALIEPRGYNNASMGRSIAGLYGLLGEYGARPEWRPYGYPYGAAYGYAGAGRLYRRMWLGGGDLYERDFERYALQLGLLGGYFGGGMNYHQRRPSGLAAVDFGPLTDTGRKPLPVPMVDAAKLAPAQRETWEEVRTEFALAAARVHDALQHLDGLAERLRRQGMDINGPDKANGVLMEGFLQDAVELIQAGNFADAKRAIEKSNYIRARLKSIIGG